MNRTSLRRCIAATATAAALTATVAACGDSPKSVPAPAATGAASGASAVSVDGKSVTGSFETTCARQGGVLALALTDNANATYGNLAVSASVEGVDAVQAVGISGSKGGASGMPYAIGFGKGLPGGSAKVVKDGNIFRVTGAGVAAPDAADPLAGPKSSAFDITFACSTIVGG